MCGTFYSDLRNAKLLEVVLLVCQLYYSTNAIADKRISYRHIPGACHGCRLVSQAIIGPWLATVVRLGCRCHEIMFFCHTEVTEVIRSIT